MSASAQIFGRDSAIHKATNILGLGIPSWLDKKFGPKEADDPTLNLDPGQSSTYGAFITRTHGTIGQSGNIIWLEKNKLKAVVKKAKKSGKGGGAPAAGATVTYFATFAVGLCEGPIAGVRRIWVGTNLVYDAGSDDLESIIASNNALKNFKIYLGTDTQAPNSRIQADRGAANTSAYPGLAYIVVTDLALANYGNSIQGAQIKVEAVNSGSKITPTLNKVFSFAGTPCHSDGSLFQTFEVMGGYITGDIGGTYTASVKFRDYTINGSLVSESIVTQQIRVRGTSNISYYETNAVIGKRSCVIAHRKTLPPALSITGMALGVEIAAESLTLSMASYAAGYYWTAGIYGSYRISGTDVLSYALPNTVSGERQSTMVCEDLATGYIYAQWTSASTDKTYIGRINTETAAVVWSGSIGTGYSYFPADTYGMYVNSGTVAINNNGKVKVYDVSGNSLSLMGERTSARHSGSTALLADGISIVGSEVYQITYSQDESLVPLSSIISAEVDRSAIISASDIDTAGIADSVIGYRVTAAGSVRNALEPLRAAFPFDAYQSGYKIRFRSRGTASIATIPIGNLIADTQLEESREMDSQLPQRVTVQCLDRDRNYDQNEQSEDRLGAESADEQTVSIQVVMTSDQAKQVAEKLLYLAWLERSSYSFKLPPIYSALEPSDVITITSDSASYELRLVSASPDSDGLISCSGVPNNAAIYTSTATADGGQQASVTIPLAGASVMTLLDIPVVDETVQNSAGFVAAMTGYTSGWSGGGIYSSADDGQTWVDLQGFGDKGTLGYAQTPLAVNAGNLVQAGGSLTVSLLSGSLDSVTEAQMLNGSNIAAYGASGRWEIIRFQNAALNADGSYTLSTFWRGDKGTEWATGLHQSGDLFVLLNDPDNAFIGMSQDSIGQPRTYRAVTFGADIDSASDTAMTYTGVNLECLSPCHPSSSRDGSGNLTANWVRRTRVGGAWRDYVDASLGETSEAYEIDVMSGSTVKRTLTSSTQSVIYTAANQVADFGSVQASITLRIYQLSSVVGRGYPLETTL